MRPYPEQKGANLTRPVSGTAKRLLQKQRQAAPIWRVPDGSGGWGEIRGFETARSKATQMLFCWLFTLKYPDKRCLHLQIRSRKSNLSKNAQFG
jgi:hypothetical protein